MSDASPIESVLEAYQAAVHTRDVDASTSIFSDDVRGSSADRHVAR